MNTAEQNYHDELLSLSPIDCAYSYDRIANGAPSTGAEINYYNYWISADQEESEYLIFSSMYDTVSNHEDYSIAFDSLGYSLEPKCKRKKAP